MVGGPGKSTDYDRLPLMQPKIQAAYDTAESEFSD
jgi:hypothetical protein